jgi:2-polyprenyl-3-methyl-5-hydroxy-6-metoxy-1,4-benzoquinol methylase
MIVSQESREQCSADAGTPAALCRFCGAPLTRTFVDLGKSPLANAYLKPFQVHQMERFYPLHVYVCERCLLVQLQDFEAPEHIFSDYAYFSSYSDLWLAHARTYTRMATQRFHLTGKSQVVEIASNDGYLLQYFVEQGIPVLGIEPAVNVAEVAIRKGIPSITRFFGQSLADELASQGKQADLVVGNNVLAHVPDLNDFIRGLKRIVKPHGVITLEFPHLLRLMAENQFDTIYHEHFSYFAFCTVELIFASHQLTIFDVEELPTHGGSLRLFIRHAEDDSTPVTDRVSALLAKEVAAGLNRLDGYLTFSEQVQETKRSLLDFLVKAKREGKRIAGYGAPAKGNTLLNYCGIRTDFLDYTVDRSPHKQGHFLPGTHIPILDPGRIRQTRPDYLLVLPWNLKDEVARQMGFIREWGGRFVVPIPRVEVFDAPPGLSPSEVAA